MCSLIMWDLRSIESTLFDYRAGRVHKITKGRSCLFFGHSDGPRAANLGPDRRPIGCISLAQSTAM